MSDYGSDVIPENERVAEQIINDEVPEAKRLFITNDGEHSAIITFYQFVKASRTSFDDVIENFVEPELEDSPLLKELYTLKPPIRQKWTDIADNKFRSFKELLATNVFEESNVDGPIRIPGNEAIERFIKLMFTAITGYTPIKPAAKGNQERFNRYIGFMSTRTHTIPIITYSKMVTNIENFQKQRFPIIDFDHIYLQIYDVKHDTLLNFNSNTLGERVSLNNKIVDVFTYQPDYEHLDVYYDALLNFTETPPPTRPREEAPDSEAHTIYNVYDFKDVGIGPYMLNRTAAVTFAQYIQALGLSVEEVLFIAKSMIGLNSAMTAELYKQFAAAFVYLVKYEMSSWMDRFYNWVDEAADYHGTDGYDQLITCLQYIFKAQTGYGWWELWEDQGENAKVYNDNLLKYYKFMGKYFHNIPYVMMLFNDHGQQYTTHTICGELFAFAFFYPEQNEIYNFFNYNGFRIPPKVKPGNAFFPIMLVYPYHDEFNKHFESLLIDNLKPLDSKYEDGQLDHTYSYHFDS